MLIHGTITPSAAAPRCGFAAFWALVFFREKRNEVWRSCGTAAFYTSELNRIKSRCFLIVRIVKTESRRNYGPYVRQWSIPRRKTGRRRRFLLRKQALFSAPCNFRLNVRILTVVLVEATVKGFTARQLPWLGYIFIINSGNPEGRINFGRINAQWNKISLKISHFIVSVLNGHVLENRTFSVQRAIFPVE